MRYYRGQSLSPKPSQEVEMLKPINRTMVTLTAEEVNRLQTPIVCEMWDKTVGLRSGGRIRREWLKQFSKKERKRAGYLHSKFHKWYLVTGTPQYVVLSYDTILFTKRLVEFFACI